MPPSIDESKCVLITGATSGIGRSLALEIAKLPSEPQVIGAGRRQDRLEELAKAGLQSVYLDVGSDTDTLKKSVDNIIMNYTDLDTVILNAGIQHELDFRKEIDLAKVVQEVTINYTSVVAMISFIMPHFLKLSEQGRSAFFIIVTSGLAIQPGPQVPNYSATKAALHSLTLSLRAQLRDTNIHVQEIIPPLVESELHDASGTTERLSKIWMPLEEYIKTTMASLRKGDPSVCAGMSQNMFNKYETGKAEQVIEFQKMLDGRSGK